MSSYETIEGEIMVTNVNEEIDYSGVSVSDERPGFYRVYWNYNPFTQHGGITNDSWPEDMLVQDALSALDSNDPATIDAVSAIVYYYTNNLVANADGEVWQEFRDYYKNLGCIVF